MRVSEVYSRKLLERYIVSYRALHPHSNSDTVSFDGNKFWVGSRKFHIVRFIAKIEGMERQVKEPQHDPHLV